MCCSAIRRRRFQLASIRPATGVGNSNANAASSSDSEENRQAVALFFIVIMFLLCNVPRIGLNFYEVLTVEAFRQNKDNECFSPPMWIMVTTLVSLVLMTLNSSVNFFIYCFVNATFRRLLLEKLRDMFPCCHLG